MALDTILRGQSAPSAWSIEQIKDELLRRIISELTRQGPVGVRANLAPLNIMTKFMPDHLVGGTASSAAKSNVCVPRREPEGAPATTVLGTYFDVTDEPAAKNGSRCAASQRSLDVDRDGRRFVECSGCSR